MGTCCCKIDGDCPRDHRHCFTYTRTKKRHNKIKASKGETVDDVDFRYVNISKERYLLDIELFLLLQANMLSEEGLLLVPRQQQQHWLRRALLHPAYLPLLQGQPESGSDTLILQLTKAMKTLLWRSQSQHPQSLPLSRLIPDYTPVHSRSQLRPTILERALRLEELQVWQRRVRCPLQSRRFPTIIPV